MTNYFLSTTGNDNNLGTQNSPFATFKKGLELMVPGDVLFVRGGVYDQNINSFTTNIPSGTSYTNAITIKNFTGENVTLQPQSGISAINLNYSSTPTPLHYVIFDGISTNGLGGVGGVFIDGPTVNHIRYMNASVYNTAGQGIAMFEGAPDCEILFCDIYNNGRTFPFDHGLYVAVIRLLIDGCNIHNNNSYGLQVYSFGHGATESNGTIVRNCSIHNNGYGGCTLNMGDGLDFYNNLVYDNPSNGVNVTYNSNNFRVYNNTIFRNNGAAVTIGDSQVQNVTVNNNIFFQNASDSIVSSGGTFTQSKNFTSNPLFLNTSATPDLHIPSNSLAIDFGSNVLFPTTDKDGNPRPFGSLPDAGAYEFGVVIQPSTVITCDDSLPWTLISSGTFVNNTLLKTVNFSIKPARWICFRAISEVNGNSWASCAELSVLVNGVSLLPKSSWSIWCFDSQETGSGNLASNCIDENINTFWHTQFITASPSYPHNVVIDLGTPHPLNGFTYLPRQDGGINGTVAGYEFYISDYFIPIGRVMVLTMMQPFLSM